MKFFSIGAALALCAASAMAADPPHCNKHELGKFWPAEANESPLIAAQLSRSGDLRVCGHSGWRYKWMQPSVSVEQLRSRKWKNPPPEGEADRNSPTPPAHDPPENSPNGQ